MLVIVWKPMIFLGVSSQESDWVSEGKASAVHWWEQSAPIKGQH